MLEKIVLYLKEKTIDDNSFTSINTKCIHRSSATVKTHYRERVIS